MARRKRSPLPDISSIVEPLQDELGVRFFQLREIPRAVAWAERGYIAIHENYHTRRRQSYHVICGERDNLLRFCKYVGVSSKYVTASEFYHFWHLTWIPLQDDQ